MVYRILKSGRTDLMIDENGKAKFSHPLTHKNGNYNASIRETATEITARLSLLCRRPKPFFPSRWPVSWQLQFVDAFDNGVNALLQIVYVVRYHSFIVC